MGKKLYTFLDENAKIIEEVRADNHEQAVRRAGNEVNSETDFYSESLDSLNSGS